MTRRRVAAAAATATAGAGAAVAGVLAGRRWASTHDPTGGEPLCLPAGTEERVRTADGAELAVLVAGGADADHTFVLSHCWTGDRRVWGPVACRLADRGHRVVLYDQRGHGRSTAGSDGLTLRALGADVRTVMEHVDARGAVLAGHSMGGMAALSFAVEHPDALRHRVRALALVATACDGIGRGPVGDRLAKAVIGSPALTRLLSRRRLGPALVRGSVGRAPVRAHLEAVCETYVGTDPATRVGFLVEMLAIDLGDRLGDVAVPALVLAASRDQVTPPARAERIADLLRDARLEVVPGAGHMLPWEAPDRLADLLEALAAEPAAASPRRAAV